MKKTLLIACILTSFIGYSQQNETWVFSGELAFKNETFKFTEGNSSESETNELNLIAKAGYLFTNTNIEIGIGLGYSSYQNDNYYYYNYDNDNKFITTTVAPYVKKYFPVGEKFAFHLIGEVGLSKTYLEASSNSNEVDINAYGIALRPGFVYFLTEHFALNANIGSLGYISTTSRYSNSTNTKNTSFGFNLGAANLLFGFSYYL